MKKTWNALSVGRRLAAGFGIVCLACVVVALVGRHGASNLDAQGTRVADGARTFVLLGTVTAEADRNSGDTARHLYVFDGDLKTQDTIAAEIRERVPEATAAIAKIARLNPGLRDEVATVDAARKAFDAQVATALRRSRAETVAGAEDRDGSRNHYLDAVLPADKRLQSRLTGLR